RGGAGDRGRRGLDAGALRVHRARPVPLVTLGSSLHTGRADGLARLVSSSRHAILSLYRTRRVMGRPLTRGLTSSRQLVLAGCALHSWSEPCWDAITSHQRAPARGKEGMCYHGQVRTRAPDPYDGQEPRWTLTRPPATAVACVGSPGC